MSDEYETLVREQLNALGYNSDAIPDEVRRALCRRVCVRCVRSAL